MLEFLLVRLNYKFSMDLAEFKDLFMRGAKDIILPLLHWMLNRIRPDLQKRAYLSRNRN